MAEVHLPHLDENEEEDAPVPTTTPRPRGRSLLTIGFEVVLISAGVFLGLAGEQWRENARHRELAKASLRNFRAEIQTNRKAIAAVKDYHDTTKKSLETYLEADAKAREAISLDIQGIQPVFFEHTAWDVGLATQSLAYIDPQLVFALSRIYNSQQEYADLTRGIMQSMYLRPPSENFEAFSRALVVYYGDVVAMEPALLAMYDEVLPRVDQTLGERPGDRAARNDGFAGMERQAAADVSRRGELAMNVQFASDFLLWCVVLNYVILLWWLVAFVFAHGWMFKLHSRWFHLSEERFDSIHYAGMSVYKVGILLFNLTPYVALRILESHGN
jgi:hypothetical protein